MVADDVVAGEDDIHNEAAAIPGRHLEIVIIGRTQLFAVDGEVLNRQVRNGTQDRGICQRVVGLLEIGQGIKDALNSETFNPIESDRPGPGYLEGPIIAFWTQNEMERRQSRPDVDDIPIRLDGSIGSAAVHNHLERVGIDVEFVVAISTFQSDDREIGELHRIEADDVNVLVVHHNECIVAGRTGQRQRIRVARGTIVAVNNETGVTDKVDNTD